MPTGGACPKTPVILFKTPSDPLSSDPYHQTLSSVYDPHFVSVLKEEYHTDELCQLFREQEGGEWEAVVITSRRGAEGWIQAVQTVKGDPSEGVDWRQVPLWTVGQSSSEAIRQAINDGKDDKDGNEVDGIRRDVVKCYPTPDSGRTAKSASTLVPILLNTSARFTSDHCKSASFAPDSSRGNGVKVRTEGYRPYLLIKGDKSLEEIPTALRQAGRTVVELTIYSTTSQPHLSSDIASVLAHIPENDSQHSDPGHKVWLAFFSPSSAAFVLPHLPLDFLNNRTTICVIGETTRAWVEARGIKVDAVAEEPTATGVFHAVSRVDAEVG